MGHHSVDFSALCLVLILEKNIVVVMLVVKRNIAANTGMSKRHKFNKIRHSVLLRN